MSLNLNLNDAALQSLVAEAIVRDLDANKRELLIKEAIAYIFERSRNNHTGSYTTPIQDAYNQALRGACYKIVEDMLKNDTEVMARLTAVVTQGLRDALNQDGIGPNIAEAIAKALSGERR